MTDVRQILSAPGTFDTKRNWDALKKANARMNNPEMLLYDTASDLQESGTASEYSRLQGILARLPGYKLAGESANARLGQELKLLKEFKDVVGVFQELVASDENTNAGKNRPTFAIEALTKIQNIFNTKVNGEFLLGGANKQKSPLTEDITQVSNIVNDKPSANYVKGLTPNVKIVPISDLESVRTGLHAGEEAFQTLIAALSLARTVDPQNVGTNTKIANLLAKGNLQLGQLEANVLNSTKQIEAALEGNAELALTTEDSLDDDFRVQADVEFDKFTAARDSLQVSLSMQKQMHEIFSFYFRLWA